MPRIKMRTLMMGPNVQRYPGKVYDVPEVEAAVLIDAGAAESVEPRPKSMPHPAAEQAVLSKPSAPVLPGRGRR